MQSMFVYGRREMITGDMLKPGAAVIDVGINQKEDASKKRGYRLVGDVEFESAKVVFPEEPGLVVVVLSDGHPLPFESNFGWQHWRFPKVCCLNTDKQSSRQS